MATVKEVILKHQKKEDGTWNIKIRVTKDRKSVYLPTSHYVTAKQLKKDFTIKDTFLTDMIAPVLAEYRKQISALGIRGERMTANEIADHLGKKKKEHEGVNFVEFCRDHIAQLKDEKKLSSADNLRTVLNSIIDFYETDIIMASDITALKLKEYEKYLKGRRVMYRENQFGKIVKIVRPGLTSGLHNYMRDLRLLFNAARDRYNDEDNGIYRIPHYPFRKYKVEDAPAPEKRNLTIDQIRCIRDCPVTPGTRAELARDLFMLSFYLCGMNAKDIYLGCTVRNGRVEYNRSKTTDRRKDKAFISIKAIPEVLPIIEKYSGTFTSRYACADNLTAAIIKGLKEVAELCEMPRLTFYHARHTFGDSARNICRFSKDDVALAMNHVDQSRKTTDKYISPNWSIVDEVQAGVISLLDSQVA